MTQDDFALAIKDAITDLYALYKQGKQGPTAIGYDLDNLELSPEQQRKLNRIVKEIMIETTHCILSGIEGECKMGSGVQKYKIYDSADNCISGELHTKTLSKFGVKT